MQIIKEGKERVWFLVREWKTKAGLKARVNLCVWSERVKARSSVGMTDYYAGYVQIPYEYKIENTELFDVHGGITYGYPQPTDLEGAEGKWTGFDMAHYGDENKQSEEYAVGQCESLAEQIKNHG